MNKRTVSERKKQHRNTILDIIRMEPYMSRSSVKTLSGLSMETVLQNIEKLLRDGLIYESGSGGAPVGRKATWLSINPSGQYFIGVKFSGIMLCAVALDFAGKCVGQQSVPLASGVTAPELIDLMLTAIAERIEALGDRRAKICGIGVGAPGVVDSQRGVLVRYAGITGMTNIPIKQMLEAEFGLPVRVDHTMKVTMLAHKMRKENTNVSNMLYVLVKSGVGMVVLLGNKIFSGETNTAGEIGHLKVLREGGRLCRCGRTGCLESEISYQALTAKLSEGLGAGRFPLFRRQLTDSARALTIADFIAAVEMDDPDARAIYDEAVHLLADTIVHAVVLVNPQKIIFSGEIMMIPGFLERVREEIWACCPIEPSSAVQLEASNQGDVFDAIGAAFLMMHEEYGTWGDAFIGDGV